MKKIELWQKVMDSAMWASRYKGSAEASVSCGTGMFIGGVLVEVLNIITKTNSKFVHGVALEAILEGALMTGVGIWNDVNAKAEYKKHNQYCDMYVNKEYEPDDEE